MDRRGFLAGCLAASTAPAFVKADNLMGLWMPNPIVVFYKGDIVSVTADGIAWPEAARGEVYWAVVKETTFTGGNFSDDVLVQYPSFIKPMAKQAFYPS